MKNVSAGVIAEATTDEPGPKPIESVSLKVPTFENSAAAAALAVTFVVHAIVIVVSVPPEVTGAVNNIATFRDSMRTVIGEHFAAIVIEPADPPRAIAAAAVLPAAVFMTGHAGVVCAGAVIVAVFIFLRHVENIRRLRAGTEPEFRMPR